MTSAQAAPMGPRHGNPAQRLARMQAQLNLTVSFGPFYFPGKKMNKPNRKATPRSDRTSQGLPLKIEGLNQNKKSHSGG